MYKRYFIMALYLSVTGTLLSQQNISTNEKNIFETDKLDINRRFFINFDKGNKLQVEFGQVNELKYINSDSLFHVFIKDIEPLKDSLEDDMSTKRIDYVITDKDIKKIRLVRTMTKGFTYIINNNDLASLKTEQDTINILIYIPQGISKHGKYDLNSHFIRYSFFINKFSELNQYLDGRINADIAELNRDPNKKWISNGPWKGYHLKNRNEISTYQPRAMAGGPGDYMYLWSSVNIENYKSYFSPSFSLGAKLVLSHSHFKREIGLLWEPQFMFANNNQGGINTFRNDFISLTFGQGPIKDNDPRKDSYMITIISLGYLVRSKGTYFDKSTWRFGAGRLSLFEGKTKIEPAIYFNHFLKGVTPSLKLIQSF